MQLDVKLAAAAKLETPRLLLRPVTLCDAQDMFDYTKNWENLRFLFPPHFSIEETQFLIATQFMKKPLGKWGIELKSEHKMIGTISLNKSSKGSQVKEVGYVLNQAYWGQGLMTEVLTVLSDCCLNEIGLSALEILIDQENVASAKVAQKVGYQRIETFKAHNLYSTAIRVFERYRLTEK